MMTRYSHIAKDFNKFQSVLQPIRQTNSQKMFLTSRYMFSSKNTKVYRTQNPINFKDNKYLLYECRSKHIDSKKYQYVLMGLDALFMFQFLNSLYRLRIFRSIIWGIPTLLVTRMIKGFRIHSQHLITKIHLKENGKQLEVTHLNGKISIIEIRSITRPDQENFKDSLQTYGSLGLELYPIHFGDEMHMLDKFARIENSEVFKAVCNGFEIDMSTTKDENGESKIIDV